MTRELIKKEILRRIDEISPFTSVDIIDNNLLDGLLDESAEDVLMKLPLHLLPVTTYSGATVVTETILVKVSVPSDFLRLINLKLFSWVKPVNKLLPSEHPTFQLQYNNQWLRGTINRPIAFLVNSSSASKEIYCFGKGTSNAVTSFLYCKKTVAELIPDNILEALFYMGAFKTLVAMEKPEQAKIAMSQFENFIKRNITA